jgi:hypothetical protein
MQEPETIRLKPLRQRLGRWNLPRTRIISSKPDDDQATSNSNNITARGVDIVYWAGFGLDDIECVSVQTFDDIPEHVAMEMHY